MHNAEQEKRPSRFMRDVYLKDLVDSIDEYDVISFDCFDTLLFRTVDAPGNVFKTWGEYIQEEYIEYRSMPTEALQQIRIKAESNARKKAKSEGIEDVDIHKIYEELLTIFGDRIPTIMEMEMRAEREHVYVNPNVYDFALYCRKLGKKLAIVSDFYFLKPQLKELLESVGVDCGIFSEILVSSEYGVTKGKGKLFEKLLDKFPSVSPDRIIHIGDHQLADILSAQKAGLSAHWYAIVPETQSGIIDMERVCYGSDLGALNSLRSLAMNTLPENVNTEDEKFWFREGCGILGPIYAPFAEWVVDIAVKENIKHILPFTREAELLTRMIRSAAQNRGVDLHVEPLFISRKAARLLDGNLVAPSDFEQFFKYKTLRIEDLFSNFYLDVLDTPFEKNSDLTIYECESKGIFKEIAAYMMCESTVKLMNERIEEQQKLLSEYVYTMVGNEPAITVDFHGSCSTQKGLSGALKACGYKNRMLHLITMGTAQNVDLLMNGIEMIGWLGYGGKNGDIIYNIRERGNLIESMINSNTDATVRYEKIDGAAKPIFKEYFFEENEKYKKTLLWQGVIWFQSYWFEVLRRQRNIKKSIAKQKYNLLYVLLRLTNMPLHEESIQLGSLTQNDNVGASLFESMCSPKDVKLIQKIYKKDIYVSYTPTHTSGFRILVWPDAVIENNEPDCFFREYYIQKHFPIRTPAYKQNLMYLLKSKNTGTRKTAVFGAGVRGMALMKAIQQLDYPIDFIVENSPSLQGMSLYGVKIISPEESVGKIDTYIISSSNYGEEIAEQIQKLYTGKKQPDIILDGAEYSGEC